MTPLPFAQANNPAASRLAGKCVARETLALLQRSTEPAVFRKLVFDNSRRRRYREAIERSGLQEQVLTGLTPTLPYSEQTSLLYRGRR